MRTGTSRRWVTGLAGLLFLAAGAALGPSGCESYGVVAREGVDTVSVAVPALGPDARADLFLYRITSLRTGRRLGVNREFHVEERRDVRAVLQVHGLEPGSELLVHLMYLNPKDKEMFTKPVHILPQDWQDPERRAQLEDEFIILDPERGFFEVESRYGVEPGRFDEEFHQPPEKRDFRLGTWKVRAYLFRKRTLETTFELLPLE